MLNCIVICRCLDKKPGGNILKSPFESVFTANATLKRYMGGAVMKKHNTTVSNPVMSITEGLRENADTNLAFKVQPASVVEQFAIDSDDCSATIVGYKPGKPLPLCRVTGTE